MSRQYWEILSFARRWPKLYELKVIVCILLQDLGETHTLSLTVSVLSCFVFHFTKILLEKNSHFSFVWDSSFWGARWATSPRAASLPTAAKRQNCSWSLPQDRCLVDYGSQILMWPLSVDFTTHKVVASLESSIRLYTENRYVCLC